MVAVKKAKTSKKQNSSATEPVYNHELQHKKKRAAKMVDLGNGRVKVLVWQLPVRIWHWLNALSIVVLMLTGLYIGNPIFSPAEGGNADHFLMGWVRIIHFISAFVFMVGLLVRIYWAFVGNRYTSFDVLKKGYFRGFWESVKFYLFLPNKKPHTIGHNPIAQFAYWVIFGGCSIILSLTGMFMFVEPQPDSILGKSFGWLSHIFGNSVAMHSWHHWAAWGVIVFVVLHIYLAIREDYLVRNGTMSSIFSGWKIDKKKYVTGEKDEKQSK